MLEPEVERYVRLAAEKAADLEVGESVAVWQRGQWIIPSAIAYRTEDGVESYDGRRWRPSRVLGQADLELQINRKTGRLSDRGVPTGYGRSLGNRDHQPGSRLEE